MSRSRWYVPTAGNRFTIHALNNHIGVILGFVELVLEDTSATDPRRKDLLQIRTAAKAAAALLDPKAALQPTE